MASKEEITQTVIRVLAETLHRDAKTIQPGSSLAEDLEMDSFKAIEMVFQLEDQYGIEIPDEQNQGFKTVSDIVEYLSNYLNRG